MLQFKLLKNKRLLILFLSIAFINRLKMKYQLLCNDKCLAKKVVRYLLFFSVLPLCSITFSYSQEKVKAVLISEKNIPIPFATVYNIDTNRGVITNADGQFEINAKTSNIIIIRCLGYQEKRITAGEIPNYGMVILKEALFELDEVIITPNYTDAKSIIRKFRANIKRNYPKVATRIEGIYKNYSMVEDEYYGYKQCDIHILIKSIASKSPPVFKTKVDNYISFSPSEENKQKREIEPKYYFSLFWLYKNSFLWDYNRYQYRIVGYTSYNKLKLVKIYFNPKQVIINKRQYSGTIFIDVESFALVFLHYEITQPYEMNFMFYNGNWQKTETLENKIMFDSNDGLFYPLYVISKAKLMVKQPEGVLTVDYVYNFFTKNIDYSPKKNFTDDNFLNQSNSTDIINQSLNYKSEFIIETEQEKQLLQLD